MIRECYSQLELMLRLYFGQILTVKKEMHFEFELSFSTSNILEVLARYEEQHNKKRHSLMSVKRDATPKQLRLSVRDRLN